MPVTRHPSQAAIGETEESSLRELNQFVIPIKSVGSHGSEGECACQEHLRRNENSAEEVLVFGGKLAHPCSLKNELSITAADGNVLQETTLIGNLIRQGSCPPPTARDADEHFGFLVSRRPAFLGSKSFLDRRGDSKEKPLDSPPFRRLDVRSPQSLTGDVIRSNSIVVEGSTAQNLRLILNTEVLKPTGQVGGIHVGAKRKVKHSHTGSD